MDIIDRINNITFWCFRLIPIGILYLLAFQFNILGTETTIIESLILAEYYLLVIVKFPKYEIAEGPLALLLFQLSIVVYAITELDIITLESDFFRRFIAAVFLLLYTYFTYVIAVGFVIRKKEEKIIEWHYPFCDTNTLSNESKCLLACFDEIDKMQQEFAEHRQAIDELKIPIPINQSPENPSRFVDYLQRISDLPNQYPALASIEQFFEIVAANQDWDNMFAGLQHGFDTVLHESENYIVGLKSVLGNTKNAIIEYLHHPDSDTSAKLFHNICKTFSNDVHTPLFYLRFSHSEGLTGKALYVVKKFATDSLKGCAQTFFDSDGLHDLNEELLSCMHSAYEDVASAVPHELDIDLFSPDFDGSAHFPFISTAIEAFRLVGKWNDGNVDMVSAAEKSAVKIAGTAGGAYIGGVIGTLLCPGVGMAIGSMVGGWLGRKTANNINRQDLELLRARYEQEYENLVELAEHAKQHISEAQGETAGYIFALAIKEHNEFERHKDSNPFERICNNELLYAVDVIFRDYILFVIESRRKENRPVNELLSYLPTVNQIKQYPKESLELMLSVESYIKDNCSESAYYDIDLMKQTCIEMMVNNIALYKTLQCTWYTEIYDAYKTSVSNILSGSNELIEEYVKTVKHENEIIEAQKRVVRDAEERVNSEARTL